VNSHKSIQSWYAYAYVHKSRFSSLTDAKDEEPNGRDCYGTRTAVNNQQTHRNLLSRYDIYAMHCISVLTMEIVGTTRWEGRGESAAHLGSPRAPSGF
jgi:hypothetical protein